MHVAFTCIVLASMMRGSFVAAFLGHVLPVDDQARCNVLANCESTEIKHAGIQSLEEARKQTIVCSTVVCMRYSMLYSKHRRGTEPKCCTVLFVLYYMLYSKPRRGLEPKLLCGTVL